MPRPNRRPFYSVTGPLATNYALSTKFRRVPVDGRGAEKRERSALRIPALFDEGSSLQSGAPTVQVSRYASVILLKISRLSCPSTVP